MSFAFFMFAQAVAFCEADFANFARVPPIARRSMIPTEVPFQALLILFNFAASFTGKILVTVTVLHMPLQERFRNKAFLTNFTLEGFLVAVKLFMVFQ